jgi:hypothetical protein
MAIVKSLLIRNNRYDGVRNVIQGSQSGDDVYYYGESRGDRFYFTQVGSTASAELEAATFISFFSMTQSSSDPTFTYDLIPMSDGNSVMIETKVVGVNGDNTSYYMMSSFGGFVNDGTNLTEVGMNYTTLGNFTTGSASFTQSGTQSVQLCISGETGEEIDWDIHIKYTKGFHTVSSGAPPSAPQIYPPAPTS